MSHNSFQSGAGPASRDYELEPIEARTRAELEYILSPPVLPPTQEKSPEPARTFTLAQLLGVITLIAVGLAVMRFLGPEIAAGLSGVLVILGLVAFSIAGPPGGTPEARTLVVVWCMLLGLYLLACTVAIGSGLLPK